MAGGEPFDHGVDDAGELLLPRLPADHEDRVVVPAGADVLHAEPDARAGAAAVEVSVFLVVAGGAVDVRNADDVVVLVDAGPVRVQDEDARDGCGGGAVRGDGGGTRDVGGHQ